METDNVYVVTDNEKESCVLVTMRRMLEIYSEREGIPYDETLLDFASSRTYQAIFDFETGIWKEGPEYFLSLYDEELQQT